MAKRKSTEKSFKDKVGDMLTEAGIEHGRDVKITIIDRAPHGNTEGGKKRSKTA